MVISPERLSGCKFSIPNQKGPKTDTFIKSMPEDGYIFQYDPLLVRSVKDFSSYHLKMNPIKKTVIYLKFLNKTSIKLTIEIL